MSELLTEFATGYAGASFRALLKFFIVSGGAFALFWVVLAKRLQHRKIQPQAGPGRAVYLRETRDSVLATLVIALVTGVAAIGMKQGWVQIYWDPTEYGLPWLVASLVIQLVGFDLWFYVTHRAMHHPLLYGFMHEKHHGYPDPSPMSAYSFTPWEALTYAAFGILVPVLMPVNVGVAVFAGLWFTLVSMGVHLGYELMPAWWGKSPLTRWIGTATMHNMHHEHTHYNFGLTITLWDRLFGTMHEEYDETLEELTAQPLFQAASEEGA